MNGLVERTTCFESFNPQSSWMSARVILPCDESLEWEEIQNFLLVLSQSSSPSDLSVLANAVPKTVCEFQRLNRQRMLSYLSRYTKECCSKEERAKFFKTVLPTIGRLASQLPSMVPSEGIPFVRAQEGTCWVEYLWCKEKRRGLVLLT